MRCTTRKSGTGSRTQPTGKVTTRKRLDQTFEQILKEQSQANSRPRRSKTAELISRAEGWLKQLDEDADFQGACPKTTRELKELVAEITKLRDDNAAKVAKFADAIVSQAEKVELDKDKRDRLETLANDDLRFVAQRVTPAPRLRHAR